MERARVPPNHTAGRSPAQAGIALVLVLWVIVLLTTIAVALVTTSRTEMGLARNRVDEVVFRAAAEAAVSHAILRIQGGDQDFWPPDGAEHLWEFAGQTLRIRIFNESSRVDLNRASDDFLMTLLQIVAGPDALDAELLAAAIRDWRDPDSATEVVGAEDDDYRSEGLPYGSKDMPFFSVTELEQLLGVSKPLVRSLQDHLTVHSRSGRPDPAFASEAVRAALELPDPVDEAEDVVRRGGPVYRIRVASAGEGAGQVFETLVRIGRGRGPPVVTYWRRFDWLAPPPAEDMNDPASGDL
jgi:general secretion pathway protein K